MRTSNLRPNEGTELVSLETLIALLTKCGVNSEDVNTVAEKLNTDLTQDVSLQALFSWLWLGGGNENNNKRKEPSVEEEKALASAMVALLNVVAKYPNSKRIQSMLKRANLEFKRHLSDTDMELSMACAALRASSLYTATKDDMNTRCSQMQEVLSRSDASHMLDERNAEIVAKRKANVALWQQQADEARRLEYGALQRFDALRMSLQEKLVPNIMRDLARYDNAFSELETEQLDALLNACKTICERATQRLNGIFGGRLQQQSLAGQDNNDAASCYDSVSCLHRLHDEAEINNEYSVELAEQIAEESGGSFKKGPLKTKERMIEKSEEDNEGDYLLLCDIDRSSVEFDDLDSMTKALLTIERLDNDGLLEIVRVKVRLDPNFQARNQSGGYRDILINYRLPTSPNPSHVSELQLHLKKFLAIKGGGGHATYKIVRSLHIFDPDVTYHAGKFDDGVAKKVRLGLIVNLNIQGTKPDWLLLRSALCEETSRVERINLKGCGGSNDDVASIIEALATGPTKNFLTKLSLAGDDTTPSMYTTLPWTILLQFQNLIELDLENGQLQGPLPDELFELASLNQLELSLNPLDVPFPEGLSKLTKLTVLMLRDCKLSGEIPESFSEGCADIRVLGLARNDLEPQSLASTLCALPHLKFADVRGIVLEDHREKVEAALPSGCEIQWDE